MRGGPHLWAGALVATSVLAYAALQPFDADAGKRTWRYLAGIPAVLGLFALFALAALRAFRHQGRARKALLFLAFAVAGQFAGEALWLVANLGGRDAPFPSYADVAFLTFSMGIVLGPAAMLGRGERTPSGELVLSMGWALFVLVGALGALLPRYASGTDAIVGQTLGFAYPIADVLGILLFGLMVARLDDATPPRPVLGVLVGLALVTLGHFALALGAAQGTFFTGGWIDALLLLGVGIHAFSLATFDPREPPAPDFHVEHAVKTKRPQGAKS